MDFLRQLISSYPEFNSLIRSLNDLESSDKQALNGIGSAFGKDFETFYSRQPTTISKPLKPIGEQMKNHVEAMQRCFNQMSIVPKDLQYLREQRKDFNKMKNEHLAVSNRLEKAKEQKEKAKATFESAPLAEKNKAEISFHQATAKEEKAQQDFNISLENFEKCSNEYENTFIDNITSTLSAVASERKKLAQEQIVVANEIAKSIENIGFYEDKKILKLKRTLKDLDYEVVD